MRLLILATLGVVAACGPAKPAESASHGDEASESSAASSHAAIDSDQPPPAAAPLANAPSAPAAPPQPSGPSVPYDREAVEIVLKRAARQVKANCGSTTGEDGKATGPWGKGTVTVKLGANGHSRGATADPTFDGKPVGKCIAQAFAILTFPPFAGGDTTIDWPIEVVPPGH